MSYRWSLDGPAFEFSTPYATENRFLTVRGWALIVLALLVTGVLVFTGEPDAQKPLATLQDLPEPGSPTPFMLGALLMATLGGLNLLQASRQRALLLVPGQPASLMNEVAHEATGASAGAAALLRSLDGLPLWGPPLAGPWSAALLRLGAQAAALPSTLSRALRLRVARLTWQGGLAVVLALGVVLAPALGRPAGGALVAVVVAGALVAMVARGALRRDVEASPPVVVAALLLATLLLAAALAGFGLSLPGLARLEKLGLPVGVAVLLGFGLLADTLALLAARAQFMPAKCVAVAAEDTRLSFEADPGRLFAEIDRELLRGWTDGIPNRRYARQPPVLDLAAEEGSFSAQVLEESQPQSGRAQGAAPVQAVPAALRLLGALAALASIAGGLLWAWAAHSHLQDGSSGWMAATAAMALVLAGSYLLQAGHFFHSRVEFDSQLIWLGLKGSWFRQPAAAAPVGSREAAAQAAAVSVDALTLSSRVARLRSVVYTAAAHEMGSRAVLALGPSQGAGRTWAALAQTFERTLAAESAAQPPALLAARARARAQRQVRLDPAAAPRQARFCSACGTPLLAGARFCQHCGSAVGPA
jgi:hypothetical protein